MGLKAKIEAVIYAAEEPVTLAQLTAVFGPEILASLPLALDGPPAEDATTKKENAAAGEEQGPAPAGAEAGVAVEDGAVPGTEAGTAVAAQEGTDIAIGAVDLAIVAPAPDAGAEQTTLPLTDMTLDEAKLARQRDRQVRTVLEQMVRELIADYAAEGRGVEVREVAGGYRMATKAEYHDAVRAFVKRLRPPMKLSLQALETLAVVAYKQPVTAPEINEVRGVDSGGVLGGLISRKLITTAGRKQVIGRPILYKTTREFLLRFGLKNINELPSIEEFEKMATEMADADAADNMDAMDTQPQEGAAPDVAANENGPSGAEVSTTEGNAIEIVTVEVTNEVKEETEDGNTSENIEDNAFEIATVKVTESGETEGTE